MKMNIIKFCFIAAWILASFEAAFGDSFELGLAGDFRILRLKSGAVPIEVRQEAQDPSIVNPYSGRYFGRDRIGTYNPGSRFRFLEAGVFGQYTIDLGSPLKPYLRGEFQYPFLASTHEGKYGRGYTYENVLGSGADYVRYTYGIKYKYAYYFEPELGLRYEFDESFSVSLGVSFQELELEYYKGIEAWGSTRHLQKLGSSRHDLVNYKLRLRKETSDSFFFSLEPSYTNSDGIRGYGIALSACKRY